MVFGAILADVVRHRKLKDWPQKQEILMTINEKVTNRFEKYLLFPIEMTAGDRLIILLKNPWEINNILLSYEEELFLKNVKIKLRWGIGTGNLNLMETPHTTTGEALYRAQSALENAHRDRKFFDFSSGYPDTDRLLGILKNTAYNIRERWTSRQRELRKIIINLKNSDQKISQTKLAYLMGMTQPAVSKMMKSMLFEEQELLENEINLQLKSITSEGYSLRYNPGRL